MEQNLRLDRLVQGPLANNVWIVGDEKEAVVIDAAYDAGEIAASLGGRRLKAILTTHGHFDHIGAAPALGADAQASIYLHPEDGFLWQAQHPSKAPDTHLEDGAEITVGGSAIRALHTPGHTPGSTCYYLPYLQAVFTGDTLFPGGPGATRWDYSDFGQIIDSIESQLFQLPGSTQVLPGHGQPTTIAEEKPNIAQWKHRGW